MKIGMSLQDMAVELERQKKEKRDFVAPTTELHVEISAPPLDVFEKEGVKIPAQFEMKVNGHGKFFVGETAHDQLANRLGIPRKYYDRMRADAPELLRTNANHWMHNEKEKRMVRTLDGNMRAFLSSRYRPLDNFDLAETVLPVLIGTGCRIESSALTEKRLYIKAVTEKITYEVAKGDIVQAGIVVSNSEIGLGSVKVEPLIFRLVCTNGMIANDYSLQKYHVGRNVEIDLAEEFFRDSTRRADDKAFWMKVRDVVNGAFNKDVFAKIVNRMQGSIDAEIVGDPEQAVVVVQEKYGLNDDERSGILRHLIKGGQLNQYGLINAITRASQDVADYDRATDLERLGGVVLELPKHDWELIANAEAN
jgi:hypothetical protein